MGALSLAGPNLGRMVCPLRACQSDITHLAGRLDLLDFFGSSEMFVGFPIWDVRFATLANLDPRGALPISEKIPPAHCNSVSCPVVE